MDRTGRTCEIIYHVFDHARPTFFRECGMVEPTRPPTRGFVLCPLALPSVRSAVRRASEPKVPYGLLRVYSLAARATRRPRGPGAGGPAPAQAPNLLGLAARRSRRTLEGTLLHRRFQRPVEDRATKAQPVGLQLR